jgi:lysophospholipase L1-like esterase
MDDDNQPDHPIASHRRRWLMRCMAVMISLTPFILIEFGLRSFAPSVADAVDVDPLVDLQQLRPLFVLDHQAGLWEIPAERLNFFQYDSFLANKPIGSRRIFVLGGSTVQGRPFSIETSFTTWLRLRLEAASPNTTFEVINCGGVSYASYRIAKILEEVLDHQPDAIVIYTGHNEFLEDREYAEVRQMSAPRQWVTRVASSLRTVTWLRDMLNKRPTTKHALSREVDARLDHGGGLDRYHRDANWRSGVETHFAATLERMIMTAKRANIPLLLCLPAGDCVNTPPFKVEIAEGLLPRQANAFKDAWAIARDDSASSAARLSACETCLAIDPEHAGASYIAGRLHYERHDPEAAIRDLGAAADFDVCPLRATTPIVQAVIELARRHDVPMIDTIARLDQRNSSGNKIPDGIVDPELFVDHVHPTIAGHQLISADVALQIEQLDWFHAVADAETQYQTLVAEHLSRLGEEYYARGRQRLEGLHRWAAGRAGKKLSPTQPND